MFDSILATLGLSKGATVGGFLGAVVSLRFLEGLAWPQRVPTVAGGTIAAAYVTPLVMEVVALTPRVEGGIAFLIGVFGMSFTAAFMKAIPELVGTLKDRIGRGR
jgi:hypothetical protein